MSIYSVLLDAVRSSNAAFAGRHAKEPEQAYLKRFLAALSDLPDAEFDKLPQDAQDWYSFAVEDELNQHKPITAPAGLEEEAPAQPRRRARAEAAAETEAKEEEATEEKAKPARRRAAAKETAATTGNGDRQPFGGKRGTGRQRKDFSVRTIRALVINDPEISVDQLMKAATDHGENLARTTIVLARSQALDMVNEAKRSGHWK